MAQPEFHRPECFDGSTTDEIHERMMASLPDDIDDMPAGFPYDFTRPAAGKIRVYQLSSDKGSNACVSAVCLG